MGLMGPCANLTYVANDLLLHQVHDAPILPVAKCCMGKLELHGESNKGLALPRMAGIQQTKEQL